MDLHRWQRLMSGEKLSLFLALSARGLTVHDLSDLTHRMPARLLRSLRPLERAGAVRHRATTSPYVNGLTRRLLYYPDPRVAALMARTLDLALDLSREMAARV